MRLRSIDSQATVRLSLLGKVAGSALGELRRQIRKARKSQKEIAIDLSEVTLMDQGSVAFLVQQTRDNVQLINCPQYLEPWMERALKDVRRA